MTLKHRFGHWLLKTLWRWGIIPHSIAINVSITGTLWIRNSYAAVIAVNVEQGGIALEPEPFI